MSTDNVNSFLKRFITEDRLVGYDDHKNLMAAKRDGDRVTHYSISDVREKICAICMHGWQPNAPSMLDQVKWRLTDEYVHETCFVRHYSFVERQEIRDAICAAKLRFEGLKPIENGYWPDAYAESQKPWYKAALLDYPIELTIGHRKRVIEISMKNLYMPPPELPYKQMETVFAAENVTKEFEPDRVMIHAWGTEKMHEYLVKMAEVLKGAGYEQAG